MSKFLRMSHSVLEAVEVEFTSAPLYEIASIPGVPWSMDDLLLSALAARLSRQNQKMTRMCQSQLRLMSTSSAEALCTLTQNCERTSLLHVRVSGNIEAAGWAALAKALSLATVSLYHFTASRELAREGRREDFRTIWECLKGGWRVENVDKMFFKSQGEGGWEGLKQVLD